MFPYGTQHVAQAKKLCHQSVSARGGIRGHREPIFYAPLSKYVTDYLLLLSLPTLIPTRSPLLLTPTLSPHSYSYSYSYTLTLTPTSTPPLTSTLTPILLLLLLYSSS